MSGNRRDRTQRRRHPHPPTPQPEEPLLGELQRAAAYSARLSGQQPPDENLMQASADLEALWQRVVNTARIVSTRLPPTDAELQRLPPPHAGDLGRRGSGVVPDGAREADSSDAVESARVRQVDGWTFVDRRPGDGQAAAEARAREARHAGGPPVLRPPARLPIHMDDLEPPTLRSSVVVFGQDGSGDSFDDDDNDDVTSDASDSMRGGAGAPLLNPAADNLGWLARTFNSNVLGQLVAQRELLTTQRRQATARNHRRAGLNTSSPRGKHGNVGASVIVRQPWNRERLWRPYVYQPSAARGGPAGSPDLHGLLVDDAGRSQKCAVYSGIDVLPLDCTNADDQGRTSLSNMLRPNSSLFATSRSRNVHLELSLVAGSGTAAAGAHHRVVERIYVMSSMAEPPCTELMVFASSRRCNFSELRKYDDFTFAQYEQLAETIERQGPRTALDDPLPIAYFWLTFEDEYEQLQILPQGVSCRYLYLKLLRGASESLHMSLRLIRVFGWDGPRSFAEAVLC
ncbi:hypothetical protein LPJ61_000996 [Coemansia biformis]|uniref:Uncharacterized protein n=1 Tax=Coemansia biformis TaxID=1286918 RepID=A0A9W7YAT1_9FUNG|nr:hypothetical protein LPJ61_000996 [Coemansia biformis]